jgi:hypothetical protein
MSKDEEQTIYHMKRRFRHVGRMLAGWTVRRPVRLRANLRPATNAR